MKNSTVFVVIALIMSCGGTVAQNDTTNVQRLSQRLHTLADLCSGFDQDREAYRFFFANTFLSPSFKNTKFSDLEAALNWKENGQNCIEVAQSKKCLKCDDLVDCLNELNIKAKILVHQMNAADVTVEEFNADEEMIKTVEKLETEQMLLR